MSDIDASFIDAPKLILYSHAPSLRVDYKQTTAGHLSRQTSGKQMFSALLRPRLVVTIQVALFLAACGGGGSESTSSATAAASVGDATMVALGKDDGGTKHIPADTAKFVDVGERLFKDTNLSASKQMACATCHAENAGHADPAGTKLPLGGPNLTTSGMRSSPTVRYLNENRAFKIDHQGVPSGGFTWDGRADSRTEQAGAPFFEGPEMALPGSPSDPTDSVGPGSRLLRRLKSTVQRK
jgi:cytochrome c peroxidase